MATTFMAGDTVVWREVRGKVATVVSVEPAPAPGEGEDEELVALDYGDGQAHPIAIPSELTAAPFGLDGYGDPYPYEIPTRLLDDPALNNRSDLDSGPSFNCISPGEDGLSDVDQADVLWVGGPDPESRSWQGGRFLITSQGGGQDWVGHDVEAAVAALRRRWSARSTEA
jgi:hypothetical protein